MAGVRVACLVAATEVAVAQAGSLVTRCISAKGFSMVGDGLLGGRKTAIGVGLSGGTGELTTLVIGRTSGSGFEQANAREAAVSVMLVSLTKIV